MGCWIGMDALSWLRSYRLMRMRKNVIRRSRMCGIKAFYFIASHYEWVHTPVPSTPTPTQTLTFTLLFLVLFLSLWNSNTFCVTCVQEQGRCCLHEWHAPCTHHHDIALQRKNRLNQEEVGNKYLLLLSLLSLSLSLSPWRAPWKCRDRGDRRLRTPTPPPLHPHTVNLPPLASRPAGPQRPPPARERRHSLGGELYPNYTLTSLMSYSWVIPFLIT